MTQKSPIRPILISITRVGSYNISKRQIKITPRCNTMVLRYINALTIVIEDVPSPVTEERINEQLENAVGTLIPIIEDV